MGYACPVCAAPQRDAEHLANHLAFVAMLHGGAHEEWLDEHAPGWGEVGPDALGERVAPHAEPATYEEVFEDTVRDAGRGRPFAGREGAPPMGGTGTPDAGGWGGEVDEDTRAVLAEARELTRRMYGEDGDGSDEPADGNGDDDGADGDRTNDGADGDGGDEDGASRDADGEEKA